jgi:hypothetical protein
MWTGNTLLRVVFQEDINKDGVDDNVDGDDVISNGNGDGVSRLEDMHSVRYIMLRIF